MEIYCTIHDTDVEVTGGRGVYVSGECPGDGNEHTVEVEAY